CALAAAEERAEVPEQVGEVAEVDVLEPDAARPEALRALGPGTVVGLPLLRVREDVVRRLDVLEPLLRRRVVRVSVRMELAGELAVGLLDLVVGRALRDAEHVVRGTGAQAYPST